MIAHLPALQVLHAINQHRRPSCVCMKLTWMFCIHMKIQLNTSSHCRDEDSDATDSSLQTDCLLVQTPSPPAAQRPASWLSTSYGPAMAPIFSLPKASARSIAPDHVPSAETWQPPSCPATSAPWALGPILGSKEKPHPRGPKVCTNKEADVPAMTV